MRTLRGFNAKQFCSLSLTLRVALGYFISPVISNDFNAATMRPVASMRHNNGIRT